MRIIAEVKIYANRLKKKVRRTKLWEFILPLIPVVLYAISLPFMDFTRQDIIVSFASDIIPLMVLIGTVAIFFYTLYFFLLNQTWSRIFASAFTVLALMQKFPGISNLLKPVTSFLPPAVGSWAITTAIFIGLILVLRQIEKQKWVYRNQKSIATVGVFILLTIFASNSFNFFNFFNKYEKGIQYQVDKKEVTAVKTDQAKRDIYYFVLDRYTNNQTLKDYFNFDNNLFLGQLRELGFTVRDDAYSNYQYTAPSIASTLRMDYHKDLEQALGDEPVNSIPYKRLFMDSPVANLLSQSGYQLSNVGNWWNVSKEIKGASNILPGYELIIFNKKYNPTELQTNAINRTFLFPILTQGIKIGGLTVLSMNNIDHRNLYLGQLDNIRGIASTEHSKPQFIFGHLLMPHPPYVYTSDGDIPTYNGDDNNSMLPREDKYINQLQYANRSFISVIKDIKESYPEDNQPIILIQADEGPYPLEAPADWSTASDEILKTKFGILAAYDLPGVDDKEKEINSPVNMFRVVFNSYFGTTMPLLPDCSYAYNSPNGFKFYDVTTKLSKDRACVSSK